MIIIQRDAEFEAEIIQITKSRSGLSAFWTADDDEFLLEELRILHQEYATRYEFYLENWIGDRETPLGADESEFYELTDDFIYNIDNVLIYDLDSEFNYSIYGYWLVFIPFGILLLNGFFFIALTYLALVIDTAAWHEFDEDDMTEDDVESIAMDDYRSKLFYMMDYGMLRSGEEKIERNINEEEHISISNRWFFNYDNASFFEQRDNLLNVTDFIKSDYNQFFLNYYIVCHCLLLKYSCNTQLNLRVLNNIKLSNISKVDLQCSLEFYEMSTTFKLDEYDYYLFYKDIMFSSQYNNSLSLYTDLKILPQFNTKF